MYQIQEFDLNKETGNIYSEKLKSVGYILKGPALPVIKLRDLNPWKRGLKKTHTSNREGSDPGVRHVTKSSDPICEKK